MTERLKTEHLRNGDSPYLLIIDTPNGKEYFAIYERAMAEHLQETFGGTVYKEKYEPGEKSRP